MFQDSDGRVYFFVPKKASRGRPTKTVKEAYHNIPVTKEIFEEWRVLRDEIGFKTDGELASHLIEHYKERKGR